MDTKTTIRAITLVILFILSGMGPGVYAQSTADKVDVFIKTEMRTRSIPGLQMAVIQHGQIVKTGNYGLANVEFSVPVTDSTVFSINSITKAFTGVAIMQLVEEGKVNIEAPVSQYLDSLPLAWQKVTIRQLMGHVSGLPDVTDTLTDELVSKKGEDSAWIKVKSLPLFFPPGERFNYNTTNYLLLGKIIDKLSGQPFVRFIQHKQLEVVNMQQTTFGNSFDVMPRKAPTYTYYHRNDKGEFVKQHHLMQTYEEFPAFLLTDAGMFSTARELARWIMALQQGKLLKDKKSIHTMWTPVRLNNGTLDGFGGILNGYALGWPVVDRPRHPAVAPIGGGRASLFIYPQDDVSIIILTNLTGCSPESLVEGVAKYYVGGLN
ncbi:serine hydrolase domain-containing protein [Chitinophaga ginsengisegetis]|uniref:serine hydrolase domain-containing protein n=1 Tax=Chitinophaga ginsengisegetis TaxID=393003 RepID=UPI00341C92D8